MERCSTEAVPWYVIPAESQPRLFRERWFRDVAMAQFVHDTLTEMNLQYPESRFDPAELGRSRYGRNAPLSMRSHRRTTHPSPARLTVGNVVPVGHEPDDVCGSNWSVELERQSELVPGAHDVRAAVGHAVGSLSGLA